LVAIQKLFRGYEQAYGTYTVDQQDQRADGKRKGQALTLREPVTEELWSRHLSGVQGIGIIPIRESHDCYWGCIDIDVYKNFMPETIVDKVLELKLPLWVFRSKSGGCHVVAFVSDPIPAQKLRDWLKEVASAIGYAKSEIFPKQVSLQADNLGNWLNMPYFNSDSTMRFAYHPSTKSPLSLLQFEEECDPLPSKDLLSFSLESHLAQKKGGQKDEFGEAPPCLEQLCLAGQYPEGSRNTGLLNLAAFRRKSIEDDENFQGAVFADNRKYMGPGSDQEVKQIIRSLKKKNYEYQCDLEPLASHCNRAICQTRKFGVAHHQASLTGLQKIASEPPVWIIQVDDHEVRLSTESLQSQLLFQRAVMEQTNLVPLPRKPNDWTLVLRTLLSKVQVIEMPAEATREGYLMEMIEDYLSSAAPATDESQIHQGVPIERDGRSYFKVTSLFAWLHDHGFKDIHSNRAQYLAMMKKMRQLECHDPRRIAGRPVRLWSIGSPLRVEISTPEEEIPF
jgi:hypothetical protein